MTTLIFSDAHDKPGDDQSRFSALGNMIVDRKPDNVVQLGDFMTMDSLSRWNNNKRLKLEGLRYKLDIESAKSAINLLMTPIREYNRNAKVNKTRQYRPKYYWFEGNHCRWTADYIEQHPEMQGHISLREDLNLDDDWLWVPYPDYVDIGGVYYTHAPQNKTKAISSKFIGDKAMDYYSRSVVFGHCFSDDTEVLTKDGWKYFNAIYPGDEVATLNKDKYTIEFQVPNDLFVYSHYKKLHRFVNSGMDALVTDQHGMIWKTKSGDIRLTEAKDGVKSGDSLFVSGEWVHGRPESTQYSDDELRLLVQCITDGSQENGKYWRWHLKKERKSIRLCALLGRLHIPYTFNRTKNGGCKIYTGELEPKFFKVFPQFKALEFSKRQADIILDEWSVTDGTVYNGGTSIQLCTNIKDHADFIQALCVVSGHKCNMSYSKYGVYVLAIRPDVKTIRCAKSAYKGEEDYFGKVWCVNVDNGTLIVRRNGKAFVTQNTHRLVLASHFRYGEARQFGLSCGCFFEVDPVYAEDAPNDYWKGVVLLHDTDIETISMERLKLEYL